jgi:thymidylate synthase (FAD)
MSVELMWATPEAEKNILYMARVSSDNQESENTKLLSYLIKHKHWSPFEMANMCVEILTTRDISAQIIRHRSFSFQEFSQRYAKAPCIYSSKPRRQDKKNRQNSTDDLDGQVVHWWLNEEAEIHSKINQVYLEALEKGIAKECARRILPMSTQTKIYMNGTLRSWMHYFDLRCDKATQLEHRRIAEQCRHIFKEQFPIIAETLCTL